MDELVSIIMPSFNTGKYIEQTINCVLNQTYINWELLVVDDCSSDNSEEIVRGFCEKDKRINLFVNERNSGAAFSRNLALRKAKGKWIAFLDSDDLWIPEKLERQISFMLRKNYHFSYTKYRKIDEDSASLNQVVSGPKRVSKRKMFNYCWLGCLTVMYDTEKIGLIQIENLKKNNDYAMWLKVSKKCDCYLLPEVTAEYRKRRGSISNHSKISLIRHHYRLFRIGEKMCTLRAVYYTLKNLFYGIWKNIKYVKKEKIA